MNHTQLPGFNAVGLASLTDPKKRELLSGIEDPRGTRSAFLTSQLPVGNRPEHTGEPRIFEAILHPWIQTARRMNLKGRSMRKNSCPGNSKGSSCH
jgi:hypothetical protein